jgi:hypothetical protein
MSPTPPLTVIGAESYGSEILSNPDYILSDAEGRMYLTDMAEEKLIGPIDVQVLLKFRTFTDLGIESHVHVADRILRFRPEAASGPLAGMP